MWGFKQNDTVSREEHVKSLTELMNLYMKLVEKVFDRIDDVAKSKEQVINGNKYISSNTFRFQVRGLRASILNELRSYKKQ